jgi:predicted transcriptional regulator
MDNTIINYLEQLGLSEFETKLYLTILETSPKSVQELARMLEINRTTAYLHIDRLIEKELVMKVIKGGNKLIVPNKPTDILNDLLNKKAESVTTMQKNLSTIAGKLTAKYSLVKEVDEVDVKYYKGKFGVKTIYKDALKTNELRSYVNFESGIVFPDIDKKFFEIFDKNPDFIMYELFADTPIARQYPLLHKKRYFRKFIPPDVRLSRADTLIYDGKVSIVNFDNKIVGTVLQNRDYYINAKGMFDFVWKLLPETT